MAQQWALIGNIVIACAYAAITTAIAVPLVRAGQTRTNRLAGATALIFFSCAIGHALHAAMYWRASFATADMTGLHDTAGWSLWPTAVWDAFTATVGIYYWTLRRGYGILLSRTGALYVDTGEQQRRHDIELREHIARGRAQAEAERDTQAAMLRAIITNSQSAIYVKDLDGRFLLANEAFQHTFGVTEAEVLGHTDEYLDPKLAPLWQANDRRAHHGPIQIEEITETGGHRHIFESNKFPLYDADGHLYAICGVSLDVTDLRAATENAEHARDEAIAQSQIKSDFLATMSHEIRTPMNGVLGLAALLMATDLTPGQRRYATAIHSAGNALLGVINDILDFSKIEAGKILLDPADFDLPALLAETTALIAATADKKGLALVTRHSPDLPATVRGDAGRVRQILLNLTGNAVKFTATGSVTLRATRIAEPAHIRFEVTDTGIGVTPADAQRLFEPFTQADASTTRTYGGTGLGLAISRQLTEAMGGTIGVDSDPGQGSTFWCEIPFEPAIGTPTAPTPHTTGLRILIVGHGPTHTELIHDLRTWQMTVTTADTTTEALDALHDAATHGRHHDVLLLDADSTDIDTAALTRTVTTDPAIPAVHIVTLNQNAPDGSDDAGIHTYLPTPVHRSALYDLLAQSMATTGPGDGELDDGGLGDGGLGEATSDRLGNAGPDGVTNPGPVQAGGRGTVLLVEDNDINQMVATGILTRLGYRADIAGDGVEACELAAAKDYDAILMDCRMPRMDGFTATARLRDRERTTGGRHTPIIAMTASALVADRERCLAAGMDDYLAKPVNPAELEAALHRWITTPTASPAPAATTAPAPPAESGRVGSGQAGSGPVGSGQVGSGPVGSGRVGSGQAAVEPADLKPVGAGRVEVAPIAARPSTPGDRSTEQPTDDPSTVGDPIANRLDELAGDRTESELALVGRLVTSFLQRAPQHAAALTEAFNAGDPQAVEDQAHSLRGAAGNIGALTVMDVCERIENDARARTLTSGTAEDLRRLRLELERVKSHLREVAPV